MIGLVTRVVNPLTLQTLRSPLEGGRDRAEPVHVARGMGDVRGLVRHSEGGALRQRRPRRSRQDVGLAVVPHAALRPQGTRGQGHSKMHGRIFMSQIRMMVHEIQACQRSQFRS